MSQPDNSINWKRNGSKPKRTRMNDKRPPSVRSKIQKDFAVMNSSWPRSKIGRKRTRCLAGISPMLDEALSHNLRALDRQMGEFFTIESERLSMSDWTYKLSQGS